jgi:hypothetical protein
MFTNLLIIICLFRLNGSRPIMDHTELTQFALKQLFYQVKQGFPEVPDAVVNDCIRKVTLVNSITWNILLTWFVCCRLVTTDELQKPCCRKKPPSMVGFPSSRKCLRALPKVSRQEIHHLMVDVNLLAPAWHQPKFLHHCQQLPQWLQLCLPVLVHRSTRRHSTVPISTCLCLLQT